MGRAFWIKRFLVVAATVFVALMAIEMLKGHGLEVALAFSLTWSVITSAVFTGIRIYRSRKGQQCAICGDTPEAK